MLEWVWVQNSWRYPHWVIQERRRNTKSRIEVEQASIIYSNTQIKRKKIKVRVLVWTLCRYPRWVMRERRGNTKRGLHQNLLYLLQCSEKSMSIQRTFSTVSTLSNIRKAKKYSDKEESTSITQRLFWYSEFDLFMLNAHKFCLASSP